MGNLVFLDIETTGLEPGRQWSRILEVGVAILDVKTFKILATKNWVIAPEEHYDSYHVWDKVVVDMHTANGLLEELPEGIPAAFAQDKITDELDKLMGDYDANLSPMCGNTINFDRGWLQVHFPAVEALFDYHNIDVSTFTETAKHFPEWLIRAPKESAHRAVPDCIHSINQFAYYLGQLKYHAEVKL